MDPEEELKKKEDEFNNLLSEAARINGQIRTSNTSTDADMRKIAELQKKHNEILARANRTISEKQKIYAKIIEKENKRRIKNQ